MGLPTGSGDAVLYVALLGVAMMVAAIVLFVSGRSVSRKSGRSRLTPAGGACAVLFAVGFGVAIASRALEPKPPSPSEASQEARAPWVDKTAGAWTSPAIPGIAGPWTGAPPPGPTGSLAGATEDDDAYQPPLLTSPAPVTSPYSTGNSSRREAVVLGQTDAVLDIARGREFGPTAQQSLAILEPKSEAVISLVVADNDKARLAALLPEGTSRPVAEATRLAGGIASLDLAERLALRIQVSPQFASGGDSLLYHFRLSGGSVAYGAGGLQLQGRFAFDSQSRSRTTILDRELQARRPASWIDLPGARVTVTLLAADTLAGAQLTAPRGALLVMAPGSLAFEAAERRLTLSSSDAAYTKLSSQGSEIHQWVLPTPWSSLEARLAAP